MLLPARDLHVYPDENDSILNLSVFHGFSTNHRAYHWFLGEKTLLSKLRKLKEDGDRRGDDEEVLLAFCSLTTPLSPSEQSQSSVKAPSHLFTKVIH